ncbi:PE/PPE family protein [Mycobacterium phage ScoobyDoobyDoo]|nr:PE/PPE family protein [Mycobacterium phage ScoobyDoobyDoo]
MNRIVPTALAAAVLASPLLAVPAQAQTVYIAGTRAVGTTSSHVSQDEAYGITHVWKTVVVPYPRTGWPLVGEFTVEQSVAIGTAEAHKVVKGGDTLYCVSQGCLVAEQFGQETDVSFVRVSFGDPGNSDGGFTQKLPKIPTIPKTTPSAPQENHVYSIEYDFAADAPDYPNPVSWANAVMGGIYDHPKYSQGYIWGKAQEDKVVQVDNEDGKSNTTHYLIKQDDLPLTRPVRDTLYTLAPPKADKKVQRFMKAVDKVLKPIVDSGYKNAAKRKPTTSNVVKNPPWVTKTGDKPDVTTGNKVEPKKTETKTTKGGDHDDQEGDGAGAGASGVSGDPSDD